MGAGAGAGLGMGRSGSRSRGVGVGVGGVGEWGVGKWVSPDFPRKALSLWKCRISCCSTPKRLAWSRPSLLMERMPTCSRRWVALNGEQAPGEGVSGKRYHCRWSGP